MPVQIGNEPTSIKTHEKIQPTTRQASNEQALANALAMVAIRTPSWRDLAVDGEARRKWLAYWFWDLPLDGVQWLLFHLAGILPVSFVSASGGLFGRIVAPRFFPAAAGRCLANLRWLEPTWSEARIREVASSHFDSLGRLRAEFSVLHRLMPGGRISVENAELAKDTMRTGPVILVGTHMGNWEILGPVMAEFGIPGFDIFEPPTSRMQARLALKVRARVAPAGSVAFVRNANAARAAVKWLKDAGALVIFCDEVIDGASAAPFFGRPPRLDGNYAVAVRLARLTGATLMPFQVRRHPGCLFTLRFEPPIRLAPTDRASGHLLQDVVKLNNAIEPLVRAHLDQWFWLDCGFAGVRYSIGS